MTTGVGERVTNKEVEIRDQSPTKDRRVRFAVDDEVRAKPTAEPTKQDQHAPIKIVMQVSQPGVISDHRIGHLNQCRCYPYQKIG